MTFLTGVLSRRKRVQKRLLKRRRILEEEGAFALLPVENVVVPQEAAATDLGSANAYQNVKIRSREDLYEAQFTQ